MYTARFWSIYTYFGCDPLPVTVLEGDSKKKPSFPTGIPGVGHTHYIFIYQPWKSTTIQNGGSSWMMIHPLVK